MGVVMWGPGEQVFLCMGARVVGVLHATITGDPLYREMDMRLSWLITQN